MTHTITASNGAGTSTPVAVENYGIRAESRSTFHDTLDGGLGLAYVPPRLASTTLSLVFTNSADAWACYNLHQASARFMLSSDETPEIAMTYAVSGSVEIVPDARAGLWRVSIDTQVVPAS
nr:hypothetical protein [Microbacterium lemovicicum]